jgi:hypothetical protein
LTDGTQQQWSPLNTILVQASMDVLRCLARSCNRINLRREDGGRELTFMEYLLFIKPKQTHKTSPELGWWSFPFYRKNRFACRGEVTLRGYSAGT